MPEEYYADVYQRGVGEMIKARTEVDLASDPVLGKITVWFYKPEEAE